MRISQLLIFSSILLISCRTVSNQSVRRLTTHLAVEGETVLVRDVVFAENTAYVFAEDISTSVMTIYDLAEMKWIEAADGKAVTLAEAKRWAKRRREITEKSVAEIEDHGLKSLMNAMLNPDFNISRADGELLVSNAYITFRITDHKELTDPWKTKFCAYERLSAYHTAMTRQSLPVYPRLALLDVFEQEGIFPTRLEFTMKASPEEKISTTQTVEITEMTAAEFQRILAKKRQRKAP